MKYIKYIVSVLVIAGISFAFDSIKEDPSAESTEMNCKKKSLLKKVGVGDTAFVVSTSNGISEKLAVTRLPDGRYKALLYKEGEFFLDYTVERETFHKVCALEEKAGKGSGDCGKTELTVSLNKKSYTQADKSCPDKTLDKMKALLFLVQGK